MKKSKPKQKVIKELAQQFEAELNSSLQITVNPDGSAVYKDYVVRKTKFNNWGLYDRHSKHLIDQYFLKTCALMAAKAYASANMANFLEIKRLDNNYWSNYYDVQVCTKNIKNTKDLDRYIILLNKLENSKGNVEVVKDKISRMFTWSFA